LELVPGSHQLEPELCCVRRFAVRHEPDRAPFVPQRLQYRFGAWPGATTMRERNRAIVGDSQPALQWRTPTQGVPHCTNARRQLLSSDTRSPWQNARDRPHHPSPSANRAAAQ
jgi:hypothetical protein